MDELSLQSREVELPFWLFQTAKKQQLRWYKCKPDNFFRLVVDSVTEEWFWLYLYSLLIIIRLVSFENFSSRNFSPLRAREYDASSCKAFEHTWNLSKVPEVMLPVEATKIVFEGEAENFARSVAVFALKALHWYKWCFCLHMRQALGAVPGFPLLPETTKFFAFAVFGFDDDVSDILLHWIMRFSPIL